MLAQAAVAGGVEILVVLLGAVLGVVVLANILGPIFRGVGWVLRQTGVFIGGEVADLARSIGALVTCIVYVPLVLFNLIIGRWSACAHFGRALQSELGTLGTCLYRMAIGHPLRLVGMGAALEGIERRVPAVLDAAPGADAPSRRAGQFDGYKIVGSLPVGGSGAKLYVAEPDEFKAAAFARQGLHVDQVVIKCFSLQDGSSLPQIVRESRSLDAAKKLRLILDHELTAERFFYVMQYVPGDNLTLVTRKLHAASPGGGLGESQFRTTLSLVADLLATLSVYHRGGLWHKDVKPDNIIVDHRDGRAHLVDFGLLTSLRSAMTLTTHGTEYFRDPDMVRKALEGVKVHEVDGTRFDIYGAGAVLYSMLEDSFPAHGALSQFSKKCPECMKWIVRRAMTDYDKRYPSAEHMLGDLKAVMACANPFELKPFDLPSMQDAAPVAPVASEEPPALPWAAKAPTPASPAQPALAPPRSAPTPPRVRLVNWWTGAIEVEEGRGASLAPATPPVQPAAPAMNWVEDARAWAERTAAQIGTPGAPPIQRPSARVQLENARKRLDDARSRAAARMRGREHKKPCRTFKAGLNPGVAVALVAAGGGVLLASSLHRQPGFPPAPQVVMTSPAFPEVVTSTAPKPWTDPMGQSTLRDMPRPLFETVCPAGFEHVVQDIPAEGRVMVINDVMQPWSNEFRSAYEAAIALMADGGATVLTSETATEGDAVDLLARARLAIGKAPVDGASAPDILLEWMKEHPGSADAIVWITPPRPKSTAPGRAYIFPGPTMYSGQSDLYVVIRQSLLGS